MPGNDTILVLPLKRKMQNGKIQSGHSSTARVCLIGAPFFGLLFGMKSVVMLTRFLFSGEMQAIVFAKKGDRSCSGLNRNMAASPGDGRCDFGLRLFRANC